MRKKVMLSLLLFGLFLGMSGCAVSRIEQAFSGRTESEESKRDDKDRSRKEEEEEDEDFRKSKKSSGAPVLGDEEAEGYEEFDYLYGDILMTASKENKQTGKMERTKLWAFIPKTNYAIFSGDYAYSNSMGVNFRIELDPYITYQQEDYLPEENLVIYLENHYDPFYTADYKDLIIGDVEETEADGYRAVVEYCEYDRWDDDYSTVFATYYLKELENNVYVLVSVEVNEKEVTGKTPLLLKELEEFYQFDIEWDKDRAEEKREEYVASGGDHIFSTGYLVFELPEDWAEVTEGVSYDQDVYAPGGDLDDSGCYVSFYREYLGYGEEIDVEGFADEITKKLLEEELEAEVTELNIEFCETCLGTAAKISYRVEMNGYKGKGEVYFIPNDYETYTIQAIALDDASDDPFEVVANILENGQAR